MTNASESIIWKPCLIRYPTSYPSSLSLCLPLFPAAAAKSLQSCRTLCNPIAGSPPGSPVPGTIQARTLEWVAISFSNAQNWNMKVKSLNRVRLFSTPWSAAHRAPPSMGFSGQEYWHGLTLPSPPLFPILILLKQWRKKRKLKGTRKLF